MEPVGDEETEIDEPQPGPSTDPASYFQTAVDGIVHGLQSAGSTALTVAKVKGVEYVATKLANIVGNAAMNEAPYTAADLLTGVLPEPIGTAISQTIRGGQEAAASVRGLETKLQSTLEGVIRTTSQRGIDTLLGRTNLNQAAQKIFNLVTRILAAQAGTAAVLGGAAVGLGRQVAANVPGPVAQIGVGIAGRILTRNAQVGREFQQRINQL